MNNTQKSTVILAFLYFLSGSVAFSQDLPIKELVKKYYPKNKLFIGIANHQTVLNQMQGEIMNREFDYATPSNDFKQTTIHPKFNIWQWEKGDAWIEQANNYKQILRIHGPISPQCSKWVKEDNRTPEELSRMLDEYMTALCKRYGKEKSVKWIDVINETIAVEDKDDPLGNIKIADWFSRREGVEKWENPWTAIGYDEKSTLKVPLYIDRAFEIANKYAPKLKFVINEHGQFEEAVWAKMKLLVNYLRNEKHRKVDAIGWQAHIDAGWEKKPGNLQRLSDFVDWCHANKLEFHITEMNVWLKDKNAGQFDDQANTVGAIFDLLLPKVKSGIIGVNFWNVMDKDVPYPQYTGTLWDDNGVPRPAYFRIKESLIKNAIKK